MSGEETRAHRIVREAVRDALSEQGVKMASDATAQSVDLEIAGQKAKITGDHVNLLLTLVTAVGVGILIWVAYNHQQDAREASAAFVSAIKEQTGVQKEQTQVMREANCLQSYQGPADQKAPFCKQVTR